MNESKSDIRKKIRKTRQKLSESERGKKNEEITQKLEESVLFQEAKTILIYVSNEDEVDTHEVIKRHIKEKTIVIPVTREESQLLKLCHLEKWEDLEPGHFGILEVPAGKHIAANHDHIDLVIVPAIAIDETGHRIGYGRGYYDRLLETMEAKTIGLAYECQIVEKIPHEEHDVPVETIITEGRILHP